MAATTENPIIFYDIFAVDGSFSPSTYKARLTLNYKRLPYRIEFVSFADIETRMIELGAPACSDKGPKYRLPVIADPSDEPGGKPNYIADSFTIAAYLDEKYPEPRYPTVFPNGTRALQKITSEFFTLEIGLALQPIVVPPISKPGFLDDRGRDYFCRTREGWFGDLTELEKKAPEIWKGVTEKLGNFSAKFDCNEKSVEDGPFVMGNQISYTDFAVAGIMHWLRRADLQRWEQAAGLHGGRWARICAETDKLEKASTQVA